MSRLRELRDIDLHAIAEFKMAIAQMALVYVGVLLIFMCLHSCTFYMCKAKVHHMGKLIMYQLVVELVLALVLVVLVKRLKNALFTSYQLFE